MKEYLLSVLREYRRRGWARVRNGLGHEGGSETRDSATHIWPITPGLPERRFRESKRAGTLGFQPFSLVRVGGLELYGRRFVQSRRHEIVVFVWFRDDG